MKRANSCGFEDQLLHFQIVLSEVEGCGAPLSLPPQHYNGDCNSPLRERHCVRSI